MGTFGVPPTPLRIVLFDFDGTLVDSRAVIVAALRTALDGVGVAHDHHDDDVLAGHIGVPLPRLFPELGVGVAQAPAAVAHFQSHFREHGTAATAPFPGIEAMLDELVAHGLTLGVATAKPERVAMQVLQHLGWDARFAVVAGANEDETGGDKDAVIGQALDRLSAAALRQVEPSDVVMVGDRAGDVVGARHHGIDAIGVTWGFGSREELTDAGPSAIADTVAELGRLLAQWAGLRT